jgi:phenylacetate-CoA ligase
MTLINRVKEHYFSLPEWMLQLGGEVYYTLPQKIRYGNNFCRTSALLKKTEYLSKNEIDTLVNERFIHTVRHAYNHVPYYHHRFDEFGVNIHLIKDIRDTVLLPTIDKDELRNYSNELIANDVDKKKLLYITTSGSTGNPVGFYQEGNITMTEWAYTLHIWSRIGYKPDSSRLVLRGKKIHPNSKDPDLFYDPLRRELSCNIFNMKEETMEKYCNAIDKYKPDYIHGYMSAILLLSKYIATRKKKLKHHFKGILATSETILSEQKEYVERIFNTRVFSFYGHSERLVIAGECEHSSYYHVEPLYGFCEIADEQGRPVNSGEIIATGFLNDAMPLIRYRTGDMASWDQEIECKCGRKHLRLSGVSGRWNQDMLVNSDGAYVSLTALNIHSSEFDKLIRYKLIQIKPGEVHMKIQPGKLFTSEDAIKIQQILEEKSNNKIDFIIELVDDLPIQKNGKYRIVEQHLSISLK